MMLTKVQRLMLFALGQFYHSLNQPLVEKPLQIRTSKIAFIEHLRESSIVSKQERALYKNLETLEQKRLISYDHKIIRFTESGLKECEKINKEIEQFNSLDRYFEKARP
ncbi:MAG: hypothetical protein AABX05_04220, partial [Nanoarchaeota archaeon]